MVDFYSRIHIYPKTEKNPAVHSTFTTATSEDKENTGSVESRCQGEDLSLQWQHGVQPHWPNMLMFPSPCHIKMLLNFWYLQNYTHLLTYHNLIKRYSIYFFPQSRARSNIRTRFRLKEPNQTTYNAMSASASTSRRSSKRNKQLISTKWHEDISLKNNYIFPSFTNNTDGQTEMNPLTAEKPSDRSFNKWWDKSRGVRTAMIPALPKTPL